MAKLTNGYSFAYQALGFYCFKSGSSWRDNIVNLDAALEGYIYQKLWMELSETDRKLLSVMAENNFEKISEIRNATGMPGNKLTVYRTRLIHKGILVSGGYGLLRFQLPRFREFILRKVAEDSF